MAAKHLRPFVGDPPLRAVTPEKLEHLYAELFRCREHCPPRPEAGHVCRPLHRNTARKLHYLLSSAFRRAVRWDWLDHNPARDVELPSPPHPEPKPPTVTEAARILGEVLVVRASIAQVDGEVWEKNTKLHQRRHNALDNVTIAVLNAYHQERQQRATTVNAALTPDSFVFSPRPDGRTARSPNAVTCQYRRMVDRLGIHTTFHKLRHYSATELIRAGVDIRTGAGRLGHAEGGTTLTSQGGSAGSNPVGATMSDQAVSSGRRLGLLCVTWIRDTACSGVSSYSSFNVR